MSSSYRVCSRPDTMSYQRWMMLAASAACAAQFQAAAEFMAASPSSDESFRVISDVPGSRVEMNGADVDSYRVLEEEFSNAARAAIGNAGIERIKGFRRLPVGWDDEGALPMDSRSLTVMSRFFRDTTLKPQDVATFMLRTGNLAASWHIDGSLVELEFCGNGHIGYFLESDQSEGYADASAIDDLILTRASAAAAAVA